MKHYDYCDVLVIGGGNAGICAALAAAAKGCDVLVLEIAPKHTRGGHSRHTRNIRCLHDPPLGPLEDSYSVQEFLDDLMRVTDGNTDQDLAKMVIEQSQYCLEWMQIHGVRFQPSLSGTLSLARTNAFFLGGGKALLNAYYRTAEMMGVRAIYDASVEHLEAADDTIEWVEYQKSEIKFRVYPKAVVVASGGFQANDDWLEDAWGKAARNFLIRGTPHNRGIVLADLKKQGITMQGDPTQCHAVAIDGRAPKYDGGIATRLDCVPFAIVVNKDSQRFYDEGEDIWPKRYAIWGRLVAMQKDQIAYAIIDARAKDLFMPSIFKPYRADTIGELAQAMALDPDALDATVQAFNMACGDNHAFHPTKKDGLCTRGLEIAKTNWARKIMEPPFYGYILRPGVTFTYHGLAVDRHAQCYQAKRATEGGLMPFSKLQRSGSVPRIQFPTLSAQSEFPS
ncbi:MAG: FAD-dependent tricarballylate dehydrogenase TcuA, partial [Pseudomonadota bacterium]